MQPHTRRLEVLGWRVRSEMHQHQRVGMVGCSDQHRARSCGHNPAASGAIQVIHVNEEEGADCCYVCSRFLVRVSHSYCA